MATSDRRTLLQRLAWLGAGAFAALAARPVLAADSPATPAGSPAAGPAATRFTLYGQGLQPPGRARGAPAQVGDQAGAACVLLDGVRGQAVGTFYAQSFYPGTPVQHGRFAAQSVALHTFVLKDGTLTGMGVAAARPGQGARFAVTGGTGAYAGARGQYAVKDPTPATGLAEFQFELLS